MHGDSSTCSPNPTYSNAAHLSVFQPQPVNAGGDQYLCSSAAYVSLNGSISGISLWKTTGSGTFTNPNVPNTTYKPSAADIANGVKLTLIDSTGVCIDTSSMNVFFSSNGIDITSQPVSQSVCSESYTQFSVIASGTSISYQWQVNDNINGFVNISDNGTYTGSNTNGLIVNASSSMNNYSYRCVVNSTNCSPNPSYSNAATLAVTLPPTVDAGSNQTICSSPMEVNLSGTVSNPNENIWVWTSSGTGTFSIPNSLNTMYYPSAADTVNGSVMLILNAANSIGGCQAEASLVVNFVQCSKVTGIINSSKQSSLDFYPNPAQDYITINNLYNESTIRIINQQGVVMKSIIPSGNTISVADLNSGFYIVEIQNETQISRSQLIIK